jgi:hypothetical protein
MEEFDFSGFDNTDITSLLGGGGGQDFDFSGLDNLDITSLLGTDFSKVAGDYGSDLGSELDKLLKSEGKASSLFSDDGGFSMDAIFRNATDGIDTTGLDMGPEAFDTNSLIDNFDNFSLEEGQGTQNASDLFDSFSLEEGQGTQEMSDLFDNFSLEGDQGFKFDDDTEPGSSGGTQGSEGAAGEGELGSYTGSSYGGGAGGGGGSRSTGGGGGGSSGGGGSGGGAGGADKKLVFDDDSEPGSSGGSSGSTGVAKKDDLGSYKGSTYDDSGGKKTVVDDDGNVILADGTKVTPGGKVIKTGSTTTNKPGSPTAAKPAANNNMLMALLALMAMMNKGGGGSSTGSGGTIPSLQANRSQLPYGAIAGSQARPGAGGVSYFSPTTYTQRAAGGGMMRGGGGISDLGGYSDGGRLLRGPGDGVSDSIPATIGGKQPARLATGEFVVPARIVSELGNGSTDAGAKKLYAMMDRVQKARRKTKNVAADTKAHKHLPA